MQISTTSVHIQPFQLITGNLVFDQGVPRVEAQQQFLAQVLKTLTHKSLVEVKILRTGQILKLEPSISVEPGQLILITPTDSNIKLQTSQIQAAEQLLRILIPKQGSVKEALLSILRSVAGNKELESRPPTDNITQMVNKVIRQLPRHQDVIKPALLKQAINTSGLLTLRDSGITTPLPPDQVVNNLIGQPRTSSFTQIPHGQLLLPLVKALLQPVQAANANQAPLQPNVSLRKDATEALARVILSQIKPLNSPGGEEVEIRRAEVVTRGDNQLDSFQLQFQLTRGNASIVDEKDGNSAEQKKSSDKKWTVKLDFDFPVLGRITTYILLTSNTQLEMNFWSNRPKTYALIKSKRNALRRRLKKHLGANGIEVCKIDVFEGDPPEDATSSGNRLVASHLVNEVA